MMNADRHETGGLSAACLPAVHPAPEMAFKLFSHFVNAAIVSKRRNQNKPQADTSKGKDQLTEIIKRCTDIAADQIPRYVVEQASWNKRENRWIKENGRGHLLMDCHEFCVKGGEHRGEKTLKENLVGSLQKKNIYTAGKCTAKSGQKQVLSFYAENDCESE